MTTQGRITRDELFSRIESGEIDTIITAVTDMQGRLQGKRIDARFFMEDLKNRREQTRVDVYMNALKTFANKQVYDLDDNDVLDFLIYKDINDSGRTSVHHKNCPNVGACTFDKCSDKTLCAKRHQAASMRVGIIAKLRRGFEDVGRKGIYNPKTLQGDPTRGAVVSEYMGFIRMEQGLSGVLPKQAVTMTKGKMDKFMTAMGLDIQGRRGLLVSE